MNQYCVFLLVACHISYLCMSYPCPRASFLFSFICKTNITKLFLLDICSTELKWTLTVPNLPLLTTFHVPPYFNSSIFSAALFTTVLFLQGEFIQQQHEQDKYNDITATEWLKIVMHHNYANNTSQKMTYRRKIQNRHTAAAFFCWFPHFSFLRMTGSWWMRVLSIITTNKCTDLWSQR